VAAKLGKRRQRDEVQTGSVAKRVFATMADAGARLYSRPRDLPKLIALWPHELADESSKGNLYILEKLRRALCAERRRALSGHWSYDLNRHLGLLSAYKAELAAWESSQMQQADTAKFQISLKTGIGKFPQRK
jgi:hypothetical protein